MLPPAIAGTLVADLGPIVFWLLINNKVIGLVSGALACVLIWKTDGRFKGQHALATGAALYLVLRAIVFLWNYECWDFEVYYQTGSAVVRGTDPYASKLSQYLINALPMFALFALLPFRVSAALWYALNLIFLFLAVRLCQLIVKQSKASGSGVPWYVDAHVTLAVLLAGATTWGLDAGQLVIWTTLWIYAAIYALARKREVTAGIALAAASLKITTSFPFLLLLLGRRHGKAWIAFAAVLTLLCLCLYPPDRLAGLVAGQFENVRERVRSEKSTTTPSPGLTTTTCWVWSTGSTAWDCATTASSRSCNWASCLSLVLGCSGNSWFGSVRLMSCDMRSCSASFLACFSIIEATTRSSWPCRFSTVWTGPEIRSVAGRSCTRRLRPGWCWCSTFLGEECSSDCQTGPRAADWRADWHRFWFFLTAPGSC